ncbi:nitroreductase family protein [Tissierella creatinophila]|uniref:Nitroreductase family protein n=1 Tax=Tissierella creatinophila DSM 6911 TaxID=1123403 RepID=A0A1U7M437_TISCR|nr:nitroreductase family protein [Tissierella creatinophila]OLS02045.1 nitroreductase family protein [Tissierella creatinophila DSM 6911]
MIISNFLTNRKSVRDFRDKGANPDVLDKIKEIIKNLLTEEDLEHIVVKLYENGKIISTNLEGKAGYGGVMIDSPHYIAISLKDTEEKTLIETGYYTEKLVTEIINLDFGTCWINVGNLSDDLKKETFGEDMANVEYLLAFGKAKRKNPFKEEPYSVKKGIEEIVYDTEVDNFFTVEDLEAKGLMDIFYYVRFAPSTKNLQPWRFLIKDNKIELLLRYNQWYDSILVDAGIAMYYFEQLATYDGFNSKWELVDSQEIKIDEYTYRKIAEYKL